MSKSKGASKNNPDKKQGNQKSNLALSNDCEMCNQKCSRGIKYLNSLKIGKVGKGVVCENK